MDKRPIGVFDSGLGGLTVLRVLKKALPYEDFIYFGDSGRAPYGDDPAETIIQKSMQVSKFLVDQGAKALVVACNTSVSTALETLTQASPVPIIGVLGPGAMAVADLQDISRVGVVATQRTVDAGAYGKAIQALRPDLEVVQVACPALVPLVESGEKDHQVKLEVVRACLEPFGGQGLDALVLGCTHYPVLRYEFVQAAPGLILVDPAIRTAEETKKFLEAEGLTKPSDSPGRVDYWTSGPTRAFEEGAQAILGQKIQARFHCFNA